jgi:ATP synthase protein I
MSSSPPGPSSDEDIKLARSVAERAARRSLWQAHGERSFAQNLAMIGALGSLVIVPTLAGVFLGRWLDRRFDAGVFWTGALLVAGLALGCALAWRRIEHIQQEDPS